MLNALIVGAGAISDSHIEGYRAFPDRVRIVAVADTDRARAARKIEQHGLEAEAYADYRDALGGPKVDIASVCTPPGSHAPITIACLEAGADVIVEKPMAPSLRECDQMIAAAEKNQRVLSPVAQMRFLEAPYRIKRLLDMRRTGRLLYVQTNAFFWRGKCYYDLDWRGLWEKEGGGCTLNHAVHFVDLMLWMAGRPCEVSAFMTNQVHENSEVEDLSTAILRYEDGTLGQITSSLVHHGERQTLAFQTERAGISLPFAVSCSRSLENGFPEPDKELEKEITALYESLPGPAHAGHTGQIGNVLQAIEKGTPMLIPARDGRATLELITAIYKSAIVGTRVSLPLDPGDEFYAQQGIARRAPRFFKKTRSIAGFAVNKISFGNPDLNRGVSRG